MSASHEIVLDEIYFLPKTSNLFIFVSNFFTSYVTISNSHVIIPNSNVIEPNFTQKNLIPVSYIYGTWYELSAVMQII